ncbi:BRCT domain-containing protein [Vibrio crassostreae]|uniref:BRCT domain-containing protein n=1 Tax=Vibrio crassostreae TaxID=246167 RepID=UPI00104EE7DC|nr:BRCT domain-containing protein [Vibrio crassostreae]TCW22676.1 hypothetical protein EDB48_101566 [Vibrio crassostreae]
MEFICTYVNAAGISSIQHLANAKFDNQESPKYVQGWNVEANHPKTLRYDRVIQVFDCIDKATQEFGDQKYKLPPEYDKETSTRYSSPDTMDVCFTGFAKADKESLMNLAEQNSMLVRSSVTKHLDILCYGHNAGPKKLEKALDQGVFILNKSQFETMIETGEIPEEV